MIETILSKLNAIPDDKVRHFAVGVVIYAVAHFAGPVVGMTAVVAAGVVKEIYDYFHKDPHTPDVWDAVATIAGGGVAWICTL